MDENVTENRQSALKMEVENFGEKDKKESMDLDAQSKDNIQDREISVKQGEQMNSSIRNTCNVCGVVLSSTETLLNHMHVDSNPPNTSMKSFVCKLCANNFTGSTPFMTHLHTEDKHYICDVCDIAFGDMNLLSIHFRTHSKGKLHVCEVCSKSFNRRDTLKFHLLSHTTEKPYFCEKCHKTFARSGYLKAHLLSHTKKKPHICEFCNKAFARGFDLKSHLFAHTNQKLHACEVRTKTLARNGDLKSHLPPNTKERSHACELCKKNLRTKRRFEKTFTHTY